MALTHFMRLSLRKGAHAALSGAVWQEIRGSVVEGSADSLFSGLTRPVKRVTSQRRYNSGDTFAIRCLQEMTTQAIPVSHGFSRHSALRKKTLEEFGSRKKE